MPNVYSLYLAARSVCRYMLRCALSSADNPARNFPEQGYPFAYIGRRGRGIF